jgi:hypothetical protein
VPPQNSLSDDATLQFLQFAYDDDTPAISNFNYDSYEYSIQVPSGARNVRITQLVPSSNMVTDNKVRVTQGLNNTPYAYSVENPPARAAEITLPAIDEELKFVIRVTAENGDIRTYNVTFKNPSVTFEWRGKVILSDATKELFEIEVPLSNGSRETSSFNELGEWSVNINEKYSPTSFIAVLHSVGVVPQKSFRQAFPLNGHTKDDYIELTIDSASLANMVFTPNDLAAMARTENYFLMNDIDLDEFTGGGPSPVDWIGQTSYSGNFNGNGHTINLTLKKNNGDTGLFTSLANGAVIENFTLDVKTPAGIAMVNSSHFGGVVGVINVDATYTMRNLTVKGILDYSTTNGYLLVGGLIGEVQQSKNLNIINCVVDMTIKLGGSSGSSGTLGFGGLIGKLTATNSGNKTTITNSYTTGSIELVSSSNRELIAGGLVAELSQGYSSTAINVDIINCYSAMSISGNKTNGGTVISAGLVGRSSTTGNARLLNSIALNPRVIANDISFRSYYKRDKNLTATTYALKGMLTGSGTPNNNDGSEESSEGKAATDLELSDKTFWISKNFDEAVWDFTDIDIAAGIYPTLK